ncbi:WecB/TagA/CpsF family glycosyltransferase [Tropicibacter alexandrii]|uniref:WecB/TagA/CpsF family glycosyltransferase n=1 Tax=Tropicibacter alexandrii TaxID=2267683 RepID=UPI000EF4B19D|nr:WecB/TagA/CpsF family glycosyltransferase [Tropicibacter alexandrii]
MTRPDMPVEDIIGYPVTTLTRAQVRDRVKAWLSETGPARIFACANPHSLHVAESDPAFQRALREADLLTPDGIGIVIGSKWLKGQIRDRITGHDVFEDTCDLLNETGGSVFFLGSTEHVLAEIKQRLPQDWPNMRLAGTYSPPFRPEFSDDDNDAMIAAVNASNADVLWVGMTAPKQEKWIAQNADRLNVRFIGAIGAVFDFYAGTVPRSPAVFQKLGMEWLPRLMRQPKRLWRRNFVSNPSFLARVARARLRGSR